MATAISTNDNALTRYIRLLETLDGRLGNYNEMPGEINAYACLASLELDVAAEIAYALEDKLMREDEYGNFRAL